MCLPQSHSAELSDSADPIAAFEDFRDRFAIGNGRGQRKESRKRIERTERGVGKGGQGGHVPPEIPMLKKISGFG